MMMNVKAIRNEDDYEWALKEIAPYFDDPPPFGSEAAERFDVLASLIEAYEKKTVEIPVADPIEILQFAVSSMGRSQVELGKILGSTGRAAEILGRKRRLTIGMIDKISKAWHLPRGLLAMPYPLAAQRRKPASRAVAKPKEETPTKNAAAKKDPGKRRAALKKPALRRANA
jgi:HTH-type transcriptional regulator/antitoxin HigA